MRNGRERSIALMAANGTVAFKSAEIMVDGRGTLLEAEVLGAAAVLTLSLVGAAAGYVALARCGDETGNWSHFKGAELVSVGMFLGLIGLMFGPAIWTAATN
jgi:hypothetical protein